MFENPSELEQFNPPSKRQNKKFVIFGVGSFFALGLLAAAFFFYARLKKVPEMYPISSADVKVGYFELEANKTSLSSGEQVSISVKATTTGEPLDGLNAVVQWDQNDFDYVSDQAADLPGDEQAYSFWAGDTHHRLLQLGVQTMTPPLTYMTITRNTPTLIYTLVLRAKVNNPTSVIQFSSTQGDLMVHFAGDQYYTNSVNQSKADPTKISIRFSGGGASPSPSSGTNPSPSASAAGTSPSPSASAASPSPSASTTASSSPGISPSPSASPLPATLPSSGVTWPTLAVGLAGLLLITFGILF